MKDNTASQNGSDGIVVGENSTVTDNTASENGGDGIRVVGAERGRGVRVGGSIVSGNTASRNDLGGLEVGDFSTVSGNTASENGGDGIRVHCPSNILGNTAANNGGAAISRMAAVTPALRACRGSLNLEF